MKSDFLEELYFSAAFPLPFRVLCLVGLGILGWATTLSGLHIWGIDAAGVLDLNNYDGYHLTSPLPTNHRTGWKLVQHPEQTYKPAYRLFVTYSAWVSACWVVFRYATREGVESVDSFKFVPAIAALVVVTALVCPFNVFHKPERDKFLA